MRLIWGEEAPRWALPERDMQTNALLAFGILTTMAVALLSFIASRKERPVIAAFLAAAAWLFVGLNVLIWFFVR